MVFAHDTSHALSGTAALINTSGPPEQLGSVGDLDAFVSDWGWTGSHRHDQDELAMVRRLRPRLRLIWTADEETRVDQVNALLRDARALPQLVRHDHWSWHLHATSDEEPLAVRMAVEAAMALVDVIRTGESSRLQVCAADDCDDVLVDLSRNRSRRFCDSGCGNRVAAAAYRARRSEA